MRRRRGELILLAALLAWSCGPPSITTLDPASGPKRTLVEVTGNTTFASVIWDAGTANETPLPGGFLAGNMFSVPVGASLGAHDVQLDVAGTRSNLATFTVTAAVPFGAPRLDRVSLQFADFSVPGDVNATLYVQGANVDVGAQVLINGVSVPALAHKAIRNDLFGIDPDDLEYPVYHHLAMLTPPGPLPVGDTIDVQVMNLDGQLSAVKTYTLPVDAITMDSDGDDLPDDWETAGYDADGDGIIDVDLPALGADPYRPDIFVEVDVMNGLANPPTATTRTLVEDAFAQAPVINPTTDNGIHLELDTSGSLPFSTFISQWIPDLPLIDLVNFYTLKGAHFDAAVRGGIYHYAVWAHRHLRGASGAAEINGNDLQITMDNFGAGYQTERNRAATFLHELGHNLDLEHSGFGGNGNYNPVHNSVMSYSWQLRSSYSALFREFHVIYAPLYYKVAGAVEVAGGVVAGGTDQPDYSDGMGRVLDETNLDEPPGLYNANGIDWNVDGDTLDGGVTANANVDSDLLDTNLEDFPSWTKLVLSGPRTSPD